MTTDKAEVTAKKTATTKAPAVEKRAARKPVNATPEPAAKKPRKKPKVKLVRDFSMPQIEYQKIAEIKETCLKAGLQVKRSEVLRAGLKALGGMNEAQLMRLIAGLGKIKAGHPKKPR
ncbi:MAG: hypothetical protein HY937_08985 [Nitrosomonadales bacterium]|nr:hypothetical protein [Nitrosomonadales bacterium]